VELTEEVCEVVELDTESRRFPGVSLISPETLLVVEGTPFVTDAIDGDTSHTPIREPTTLELRKRVSEHMQEGPNVDRPRIKIHSHINTIHTTIREKVRRFEHAVLMQIVEPRLHY
jgi:hypothetical protein